MGKNKLKKFADMESFGCVLQYPREELLRVGFPHKGRWNEDVFKAERPITLELGCGRGEYTVALARCHADRNFVGVDIKGARMWTGASQVEREGMSNAAFLRCEIENIDKFFSSGEVSEIWITFPDPQMKKTRKRLTSTRFLGLYRNILMPGGVIHLKTDSPFLYEYTHRLVTLNGFEVLADTEDLYGSGLADPVSSIKTYYEQQWLSRGKKIKLISFRLPSEGGLSEPPEDDIEKDDYRAIPRPSFPSCDVTGSTSASLACQAVPSQTSGSPFMPGSCEAGSPVSEPASSVSIKEMVKGMLPAEAVSKLTAYLAENPQCEEAYIVRGLKYWSLGDRASSIKDYLAAIRINPDSRANEALRAANEILDYRNKDLYNP